MSLASNEILVGGLVIDKNKGELVTVTYQTAAMIRSEAGGLPRDGDGRLVVIAG